MNGEVILSICAILTLLIFAVGVVLVILNRKDLKRVVRVLGVCVFLMLMSGIYPYYHEETYAIGLTLVESMCAMLLNSNPGEILAGFNVFDVAYIGVYKTALLVLLIIAPLFTVGITLSFFSEKFVRLIYRIRSEFRDTYLFSAINERTLCIAEDVAETDKKAVIAFALHISEDDIDAESLARIKNINAYVINDDVVSVKHSLRHTRNYYLLSKNDSENLEAGLRIYQRYNKERTDKVNMWLYTKNEISNVIFDHLYETFNVRLINEEGLIARTLATNYPVFDAVNDGRLSILIVGGGHIGLEILRTMTMCSCLGEEITVDINVIDLNGEKSKDIFEKASPDLAKKWNINFHSADVKSVSISKVLDGIDPTYIVICLGNETLNMETALYIRRKYGIADGFPRIHALIDYKRIEEEEGILPGKTRYSGEYPESEPETRAICNFVRWQQPELALSLHTQGEEIYYTSGDKLCPYSLSLAKTISRLTGYKISFPEGSAKYGGFTDWFIEEFNKPSFTLECGLGKNPLPFSDFDKIYSGLKRALFTVPVLI